MKHQPDTAVTLREYVIWPAWLAESAAHAAWVISCIQRLIDFDGTIATADGQAYDIVCGKSLADFLGEEPYVVQTWNPESAVKFFTKTRPDLPPPVMIITAPIYIDATDDSDGFGKDFDQLGISDKQIIDDLPSNQIRALRCEVISPNPRMFIAVEA